MLWLLGALVSPNHLIVYQRAGPLSALFVPALFNLFLLTFIFDLLLGVPKQGRRLSITLWTIVLAFMPWVVLTNLCLLYGWYMPYRVGLFLFAAGVAAVILSVAFYRPRPDIAHAFFYRWASLPLKIAAVLGCILFTQVAWYGWEAHLGDEFQPSSAPAVAHVNQPRVFWVVLDELSYDQVFPSRAPGLALPNLDAFAAQATMFTQTVPAGAFTDVVLPSLITGVHADSVRSSPDARQLYLHLAADTASPARWQTLDPTQTVFSDARSLGYRIAVAGWFNPYCRILPGVLDNCFWTNQTNVTAMFPAHTVRENLFYPAKMLLGQVRSAARDHQLHLTDPTFTARMHIEDYHQLFRVADQLVADPSYDFVLLHMPIPHPQGIYDRQHAVLTTNGTSSYLDNLALTDLYLAHLRSQLEQMHEWDDATVLIMGDHSWRTTLFWKDDPHWTREEQRASHNGAFDERPFYALKLPHQHTAATIDAPYRAMRTRALLEALLGRRLQTAQQLQNWANPIVMNTASATTRSVTEAP